MNFSMLDEVFSTFWSEAKTFVHLVAKGQGNYSFVHVMWNFQSDKLAIFMNTYYSSWLKRL